MTHNITYNYFKSWLCGNNHTAQEILNLFNTAESTVSLIDTSPIFDLSTDFSQYRNSIFDSDNYFGIDRKHYGISKETTVDGQIDYRGINKMIFYTDGYEMKDGDKDFIMHKDEEYSRKYRKSVDHFEGRKICDIDGCHFLRFPKRKTTKEESNRQKEIHPKLNQENLNNYLKISSDLYGFDYKIEEIDFALQQKTNPTDPFFEMIQQSAGLPLITIEYLVTNATPQDVKNIEKLAEFLEYNINEVNTVETAM